MWYLEANAKIICRHHLHDCESSRRLIYNFNELTWMLEVDIPLLFILSMTLSMLGPSTRRHCACALGGILISETIKLLVICLWPGRRQVTRHTELGTDANTAKAEPHSSSRPHWKYYLSLYNSLNPILLGLPVCESLFTLKRFPISHYTWCIQFTIQRMSNLALHFAGFLLSE